MTRRVYPEAASELLAAAEWYERARTNLGDDFLSEVEDAERDVLDRPEAARVFPGWAELPVVRSASVRVFPYRVLYYLTDTEVVIVAYAHHRRKPRYWEHRMDG
nr:type II toxin-antitoxin system RelE/ParE family toxin [Leucobacter edaphi]